MTSHDQCNSGTELPAHFMSAAFDDASNLLSYLVPGQHMQPNQGSDFPSMASLSDNDTNVNAMLDQSSSATVSVTTVPTTITSGIGDSLPVGSYSTIGSEEIPPNVTPFTAKAVNNGHSDSHFYANNCSNQVLLGQDCHNSNGSTSNNNNNCNSHTDCNLQASQSSEIAKPVPAILSNFNGNGSQNCSSNNGDGSFNSEESTGSPLPQSRTSNGISEPNQLPTEPMAESSFPRTVKQEPNSRNTPTEGTQTPVDIKPSPTALQPASMATAEKRTLVIVKIIDQIIVNGQVVDEKIRENEFVSKGGYTNWPETGNIPCLPVSRSSTLSSGQVATGSTVGASHHQSRPVSSSTGRGPGRPPSNKNTSNKGSKNTAGAGKRVHNRSQHENSSGKRVKVEVKEEHESEEERMMRETASTLLSLHTESPVKKMDGDSCESHGDSSETEFQPLHLGSFVLAKWNDKNFYPGHVRSSLGDGRWQIIFEDGGKKVVHESDIISVPHLAVGQVVMATFPDSSICLKGVIRKAYNEKSQLYYDVEYNDGAKPVVDKFSRKDIFLTPDLAASLLSKQSRGSDKASKFADVDLNNIIPKRSRTSTQLKGSSEGGTNDDGHTSESGEGTSNSSSSLGPCSLSSTTTSTAAASTSASASTGTRTTKSRGRPPAQNRVGIVANPSPKVQSKGRNENINCMSTATGPTSSSASNCAAPVNNSQQINTTAVEEAGAVVISNPKSESELETLLGPIPPLGSTLFQGLAFLLTTADAPNNSEAEASSGQGRSTAPFDIPHLVKQIESGGGRVYQTLEEAKSSPESQEILLLAYTYLRTVKYMQCLAVGITCLMHSWVIECCRQNCLVKRDDFLLPSGFSITSKSLITDRQVFKRSASLFKGVRFMLVSHNPKHAESWTSVLKAANAVIVDDFTTPSNSSSRKGNQTVDYIISDSSCPASTVKRAAQLKIPIVSSEYVVQCLINGKRLAIDANEKFSINYRLSSS